MNKEKINLILYTFLLFFSTIALFLLYYMYLVVQIESQPENRH